MNLLINQFKYYLQKILYCIVVVFNVKLKVSDCAKKFIK